MDEILSIVSTVFKIPTEDILRQTRKKEIVDARKAFIYTYLKRYPRTTYDELGRKIGQNHATLMHAVKVTNDLILTDKIFKQKIDEVMYLSKFIKKQKVVYIAHPIALNPKENVEKILKIIKAINLEYPNITPIAPYIVDVLAMDDSIPEQRKKGILNNRCYFESNLIDELWVFDEDQTSYGVKAEIELAISLNIRVLFNQKILLNE